MNQLRIITVQKNQNGLVTLLRSMKNSTLILYENSISELTIGGRIIPINFNNSIYSIEDNILILFLKNGPLNNSQLKELLDKEKIPYNLISFISQKENYYYTNDCKGLSFVKSKDELKRKIQNSKRKNIDCCTYYPNINGTFSLLNYSSQGKKTRIIEEPIRGIIDLEDKIILMHKQKQIDTPTETEQLEVLIEEDMNVIVKKETKLSSLMNHKYHIKRKRIEEIHGKERV